MYTYTLKFEGLDADSEVVFNDPRRSIIFSLDGLNVDATSDEQSCEEILVSGQEQQRRTGKSTGTYTILPEAGISMPTTVGAFLSAFRRYSDSTLTGMRTTETSEGIPVGLRRRKGVVDLVLEERV